MRASKALTPNRRNPPASEKKWRYSNIEKVKMYVLAGHVENNDLAPLFGVSAETVASWKLRYPAFREAIDTTIASVSVKAIEVVVEDIEGGNVETAKWWLKHMSKGFKDEKGNALSSGDITVQIINYADNSSS